MWLQAELLFSLQSGRLEPGGLIVERVRWLFPGYQCQDAGLKGLSTD